MCHMAPTGSGERIASANVPSSKRRQPSADVRAFLKSLDKGFPAEATYTDLLGIGERNPVELVKIVTAGLSFKVLERFRRNVDLSLTEVAELIRVPARTLSRRKEEGRLDAEESDRLLRASRLFAKAIELFEGDVDGARDWLSRSQPALGGARPLEMATTEVGTREVESLIGRLEHGIPS